MKFKRKVAFSVLATSLLASTFTAVLPTSQFVQASTVVATSTNSDLVKQLQDTYSNLTSDEQKVVQDARDFLSAQDADWWIANADLGEFVEKAKEKDVTEAQALAFVQDTIRLTFGMDADHIDENLTTFRSKHAAVFDKLFGADLKVEDLYWFVEDVRDNVTNQLTKQKIAEILLGGKSISEQSEAILKQAIAETTAKPDGTKFLNRLQNVGLSVEHLFGLRAGFESVDIGNNKTLKDVRRAFTMGVLRQYVTLITVADNKSYYTNSTIAIKKGTSFKAKVVMQIPNVTDGPVDITSFVEWKLGTSSVKVNEEGLIQFDATTDQPLVATLKVGNETFTILNAMIDVTTDTVSSGGSSGGGGGGSTSSTSGISVNNQKGGVVSESGVSIEIPANALDGDFKITIKKIPASEVPAAQNGAFVSEIFELLKDKPGNFKKPVTITLPFAKEKFDSNKQQLGVYWLDEAKKEWTPLNDAKIDSENGKISVNAEHFTKFAVIATDKAAAAPVFVDVEKHWAKEYINKLAASGAIQGYPDGKFKPDNQITRAEFAMIVVKAFNLSEKQGKVFADTSAHWAKNAISTAAAYGIVNGYNASKFGPDDMVTREQMALMLVKAASLTSKEQVKSFKDQKAVSAWAEDAVSVITENGLMNGYPDGTFKPKNKATRAEAATVIVQALEKNK